MPYPIKTYPPIPGHHLDRDLRHAFLFAGLDKTLPSSINEVFHQEFSDIHNSKEDEDRIHKLLEVPSVSPSTLHYSRYGSFNINHVLWENHKNNAPISSEVLDHVTNIERDMKPRVEMDKPFRLFSGLQKSPITLIHPPSEWTSMRENKFIRLPAFTSTSTDFNTVPGFTVPDTTSVHHESAHHGIVHSGARHVLELTFERQIHDAVSMRNHSNDRQENEVLLGRGHEFILHPRPTLIENGGFPDKIYVWHCEPGIKIPLKTPLRTEMNLEESFDSKMPVKRNEFIEMMTQAQGLMTGKKFDNVKAYSSDDNQSHFLTFDHEGAKEIHILGPNMTPFFTKNHKSPMKVFGTAISLVKPHVDSGGTVRLSAHDDPESKSFYQKFANQASRLGYSVNHMPSHEGSSGQPVVSWEITRSVRAPS